MTESQKALKAAIDIAKRRGGPVVTKRRVRDRDEGYDVTDAFVDDSELAVNEPKQMPKTKISGYCAIMGEVELQGELLPEGGTSNGGRKGGRKPGSINKPKVAVHMPDGTVKMMSEAIAAKEKKKQAKASGAAPSKAASASASPAPTPGPSSSKREESNGPLVSRDAAQYSHLPSSFGAYTAAEGPTTPAVSSGASTVRPTGSQAPISSTSAGYGTRVSPIAVDDLDDEEEIKAKKGPVFTFEPSPKKGKTVYETHEVSPGLTAALANLRKLVEKGTLSCPALPFPFDLSSDLLPGDNRILRSEEQVPSCIETSSHRSRPTSHQE